MNERAASSEQRAREESVWQRAATDGTTADGSLLNVIHHIVVGLAVLVLIATAAFAQNQQLKVPDAEQFVGAPKGAPVAGPELDRRTQELSSMLRCPVCQGLAIADSPSEMAINMRAQVRELLARGFTTQQILSYFEHSYGQFVLLKPKFNGVAAAVWVLPILAIAIGIVLVVSKAKKLEAAPAAAPAAAAPAADDEAADPYLARVRELVEKP